MKRLLLMGLTLFVLTAGSAFGWPARYMTGVTYYDPDAAYNGYTLWAPQNNTKTADAPGRYPDEVYLMDMHGRVVHKWVTPYPIWYARLMKDGTLLVALRTALDIKEVPERDHYSFMGGSFQILMEMDWDGNILRQYANPGMHHDFTKLPNGNYLVLGWEKIPPEFQKKVKGGPSGTELDGGTVMYGDTILEVDPDTGETVWTWSSMEHMDPAIEVIGPHYGRSEWTHFNSLDVLENGDIMTDSRRTDAAYIIDRASGAIKWRWGNTVYWNESTGQIDYHFTEEGQELAPYLGGPHDCHVIDKGLPGEGHMLCYDNGMYADRSRAVEVDIQKGSVVWESSGNPFIGRHSFSHFISSAQRLPNGNTFICDGGNGKFREVTKDNKVVWEYIRPTGNKAYLKWAVFRAFRYGPDYCPQMKSLGNPRREAVLTPDPSLITVDSLGQGTAPETEDEDDYGGMKGY